MRTVRSVLMRAGLDTREQSLWFGIFREIANYIARTQSADSKR